MTTIAVLAAELAEQASELADRLNQRSTTDPDAVTVFRELVGEGIEIKASLSITGVWWAYIVMPDGWEPTGPSMGGRHWRENPSNGRWWTDIPTTSEDLALREALLHVIEVTRPRS